jgi:D-serine deaminase-like pyridoxal phosphate-dependent protein
MLEVAQMLVEKGISQFKCATLAEAEMMAKAGAKDVLIAYQLVGPRVGHLKKLKKAYPSTKFSSLIDSRQGLDLLSRQTPDHMTMNIYIDIDVGHHRTGIPIGKNLDALMELIDSESQVHLEGFHAYDGHATDVDIELRTKKSTAVKELLPYLERNEQLKLVAGGSPSFAIHSKEIDRSASPGTFVFWDHGYQSKYPQYGFEYAAVLATRVISKIDHQTYCFDMGHKHVASEGASPQITFLDCPEYKQLIHSEEHLTVRFLSELNLEVGDLLYGVPRHICPTVALYPEALVIKENAVTDSWKVMARNLVL